MKRRNFITLLGGAAAGWPLAAYAQDGRTYRVGVLNSNPRGSPLVTALFDELRRTGLVEGRNLVIEGSGIGIPYPRFPDAARELAKAKVEALVVGFLVLGRQWLLLPGLALEAIPGFGVLPFWLLVVGAIAVLGTPRPTFERH